MYIIGFDGSSHDFNTYNYAWRVNTVFEDIIDYSGGCRTWLRENVKTIWLDTIIQNVLRQTFKSFWNLEKVGILGDLYDSSSLYNLYEDSFSFCAGQRVVRMNMLKAKHMKHSMDYYLHEEPEWHYYTKISVD